MIRFIELCYANALFFYKRLDGHSEKWRAATACFFWFDGLFIFIINVIQQFTGSLAPLVRAAVPAADKPYNNAAETLLAVPFALVLLYYMLWERTPLLEARYAHLQKNHKRWLVALSFIFSMAFALACGYGRANFWGSLLLAALILVVQEALYRHLIKKPDLALH
jgi:hypothetical protein